MIKAAFQYRQKLLGYRILLHLFNLFKFDNDDIKPCKIIIVKSSLRQIDSYYNRAMDKRFKTKLMKTKGIRLRARLDVHPQLK